VSPSNSVLGSWLGFKPGSLSCTLSLICMLDLADYICHTLLGQVSFTCLLNLHWSSLLYLFAQPSLVKSLTCLLDLVVDHQTPFACFNSLDGFRHHTVEINSDKIYLVLPSLAGVKSSSTSTSCSCTISTPGVSSSASAVYTPVILADSIGSGSCTHGILH
jgi:hypothetical protein